MRGGVKGRLELFRSFIRFGDTVCPLLLSMGMHKALWIERPVHCILNTVYNTLHWVCSALQCSGNMNWKACTLYILYPYTRSAYYVMQWEYELRGLYTVYCIPIHMQWILYTAVGVWIERPLWKSICEMAPTRAGTMHHVKPQFNGREDDVYKNCNHVEDGH